MRLHFQSFFGLPRCLSAGTWKPADQSFKVVIEKQGDNFHSTVTAVNPDGSPWTLKFTVPIKGGVVQVRESSGRLDGVASKIVSPTVRENMLWEPGA